MEVRGLKYGDLKDYKHLFDLNYAQGILSMPQILNDKGIKNYESTFQKYESLVFERVEEGESSSIEELGSDSDGSFDSFLKNGIEEEIPDGEMDGFCSDNLDVGGKSELSKLEEISNNTKGGNDRDEEVGEGLFDGIPSLEAFNNPQKNSFQTDPPKYSPFMQKIPPSSGEGLNSRIPIMKGIFKDVKKSGFSFSKGKSGLEEDNSGKTKNLIVKEMEVLLNYYSAEKDIGRMVAYRKALGEVKGFKGEITLHTIQNNQLNIGPKVKDKIIEILETGKLKKTENILNETQNTIIERFRKIWGVGGVVANKLYSYGFRTIEGLRKNPKYLTKNQTVGLKYYEEFIEKIPREQVTRFLSHFEMVAQKNLKEEWGFYKMECCGSYRRERPVCGDIDLIFCRKDSQDYSAFLGRLVEIMEKEGIFRERLVFRSEGSSRGRQTYMGVCFFEGRYRRIDMKIYPRECYGFALLYFTGSDYYNRSLRLFVQKQGYSLSDTGLKQVRRVNGEKVWSGEQRKATTEHEVYEILGIEYLPPSQRDI